MPWQEHEKRIKVEKALVHNLSSENVNVNGIPFYQWHETIIRIFDQTENNIHPDNIKAFYACWMAGDTPEEYWESQKRDMHFGLPSPPSTLKYQREEKERLRAEWNSKTPEEEMQLFYWPEGERYERKPRFTKKY